MIVRSAALRPFASPPSDVVSNVWTPTKSGGLITNASWLGLPLNEWCKVSGSCAITQLTTLLVADGYTPNSDDYGNSKLLGSFNGYSTGAIDQENGRWLRNAPGGHLDSSYNGTDGLLLERMGSGAGWTVHSMPSDPDDVTFPWSANYKAGNVSGSFTVYTPSSDTPPNKLPDGRRTSTHQYDGQIYDRLRNRHVSFRQSADTYDYSTEEHDHIIMEDSVTGPITPTAIGGLMFHDEANDRYIGSMRYTDDTTRYWVSVNPETFVSTRLTDAPWPFNGSHAGDMVGRKIYITGFDGDASADKWAEFDMDGASGGTWTSGVISNGKTYNYNNELRAWVWVPAWSKALLRFSYSPLAEIWALFNWSTKLYEAYTPAGLEPPFSAYPGRKAFRYTRTNGREIIVYITTPDGTADSVYVMRTV